MIVKINAVISSFIAFSVFCSVMFRKLAKKSGCSHIPGPVFKILVSLSAKKVKAGAARLDRLAIRSGSSCVAATSERHHDAIAVGKNIIEVVYSLPVLYLGDNLEVAAACVQDFLNLLQVARAADKGMCV